MVELAVGVIFCFLFGGSIVYFRGCEEPRVIEQARTDEANEWKAKLLTAPRETTYVPTYIKLPQGKPVSVAAKVETVYVGLRPEEMRYVVIEDSVGTYWIAYEPPPRDSITFIPDYKPQLLPQREITKLVPIEVPTKYTFWKSLWYIVSFQWLF